jgi:hypothetical protein
MQQRKNNNQHDAAEMYDRFVYGVNLTSFFIVKSFPNETNLIDFKTKVTSIF